MLTMAVHTFRERWTLFVGTLLSVTLGVALVESAVLILQAAARLGADPAHRRAASDVESLMGFTLSVALFLSVFIIGSTFAFAVNERRRDLALLRLGGATRRQVRLLLAGESLVVGLLGSAAGALLGLGVVPLQLGILRRLDMPADLLQVRISLLGACIALASGLGLSVLGVWVASRRAARVRPLDALRDVDAAARVMTVGRWFWGLTCAAATVAAVIFSQAASDPVAAIGIALLLIFTASTALQQLSPLVVPLIARAGGVLARGWPVGEIAHANVVDGRRRAATTAGPLIALVGIVIGLYGVILTQAAAQVRELETTTHADLVVMTRGADTSGITAVDGVAAAAPVSELTGRVSFTSRGTEHVKRVHLVATDPVAYRAVMAPRLREGTLGGFEDDTAIANGDGDGPLPSDPDELRVTTGDRSVTLPVAARTATSLVDFSAATIPLTAVDPAVLADAPTRVMVGVTPGADVAEVRRALVDAGFTHTTTTHDWAAGDAAAEADLNRTITVGLAGLGGLYALLAVVNAVALACAARKHELAVAQVTGLSRAQVVGTTVLESVGVAVLGILLGAAAAATCLAAVRHGFSAILGEPVLVVPWGALAAVGVLSLVAVAATAATGTWLATRARPVSLVAGRE